MYRPFDYSPPPSPLLICFRNREAPSSNFISEGLTIPFKRLKNVSGRRRKGLARSSLSGTTAAAAAGCPGGRAVRRSVRARPLWRGAASRCAPAALAVGRALLRPTAAGPPPNRPPPRTIRPAVTGARRRLLGDGGGGGRAAPPRTAGAGHGLRPGLCLFPAAPAPPRCAAPASDVRAAACGGGGARDRHGHLSVLPPGPLPLRREVLERASPQRRRAVRALRGPLPRYRGARGRLRSL